VRVPVSSGAPQVPERITRIVDTAADLLRTAELAITTRPAMHCRGILVANTRGNAAQSRPTAHLPPPSELVDFFVANAPIAQLVEQLTLNQ
jgi:hypothetical protein